MSSGEAKRTKRDERRGLLRVTYRYDDDAPLHPKSGEIPFPDAEEKDIGRKILLASKKDLNAIVFAGGEPALWPSLSKLIRLASKIGLRPILQTHCRSISRDAARTLANIGLEEVETVLAGADPATHDELYGPRAFVRTWEGLQSLKEAGIARVVRFPLLRSTLGQSMAIREALKALAPVRLVFHFPDPATVLDAERLCVSMSEAAEPIRRAFKAQAADTCGPLETVSLFYDGLPV